MDEPKTDGGSQPIAPAKEPANPELASIKRLLILLDKTAKSSRTYGATNPVAQKFLQQLFDALTAHLSHYSKLAFLVQRSELYVNGDIVYRSEQESGHENIAFKLYTDGIRELTFLEGLQREDLSAWLDALWGSLDPEEDDDDIVTRLWAKNLSSITLVTAEEIAKASTGGDVFALQTSGTMEASESSLRALLDREQARIKEGEGTGLKGKDGTGTDAGGTSTGEGTGRGANESANQSRSGHLGYEVSDLELAELAKEIEAESHRDNTTYLLDMLTAILASERSPAILTKLLDLWGNLLDSLTAHGKWTVLDNVLGLLHAAAEIRPDLDEDHKKQLAALLDNLGRPERIAMIEAYLNKTPNATTEGLPTVLLPMTASAIPALCTLLANLEMPAHQAIVADALEALAKDQPDPLLRGLSDRRPRYVRSLLAILLKWNNPRVLDSIEKLVLYPDVQVRKEVIRAIGILRPTGNGTKLVTLANDAEESVRLAALKLLLRGHYTAPYSAWAPIVSADTFKDRPLSEKRAIFQAMRATSGEEIIPSFTRLLTEWSWINRKKKEELASLAAEALGKLGTPAAVAALELGQKKGSAAVRQACTAALAQAQRQQLKQVASS